jgi:hypothetical protein
VHVAAWYLGGILYLSCHLCKAVGFQARKEIRMACFRYRASRPDLESPAGRYIRNAVLALPPFALQRKRGDSVRGASRCLADRPSRPN